MVLELQNIVLWDMPGSGTATHPTESYFKDNVLYAFDGLLIEDLCGKSTKYCVKITNLCCFSAKVS